MSRPTSLHAFVLCIFSLNLIAVGCTGGETSTPPRYGDPYVVTPDPMGGGEPMGGEPMGGEPMGGEPIAGEPMGGEPVAGEPMGGQPPVCEPLNMDSVALYNDGDYSPRATLYDCGGCHFSVGNGVLFPEALNSASPLSPEALATGYETLAPYITPGYGASSTLTSRMSDGHSANGLTQLTPDDPKVVAMIAWIDALNACD